MPDVTTLAWVQTGFAGMSFFLVWILATALKQIVIELSAQTTMLKLLTEQQDGGYRLVIDQLLDKLKGDDVAKQ